MSHSSLNSVKEPLLRDGAKDGSSPSSTALVATKALSIFRIAAGTACIVAPQLTCALFKFHVPVEQALVVRMFGIRDAVLGELLYTAKRKGKGDDREFKRAIWAGVVSDIVDIASIVHAVAMGHVGKSTGGLFGAGAVGAIGLAMMALRSS